MQEAQQLVLQAVKSAAPERNFEANNYFPMVQVRHVCSKSLCAANVLHCASTTHNSWHDCSAAVDQ
jgi:hypothetical protein